MTKEYPIYSPRKLIEVALPLDAINAASAKEKAIRQGHPSSLHLWWARRPLVTARTMIFAQLVNDPGYQQGGGFKYGVNKKEAAKERQRLFKIIEELAQWGNTNNEELMEKARAEIHRSWREVCDLNKDHPQAKVLFNPDKPPGIHDPFAGGGAIPLEAQRLGLEAYASDLNPVAVMINKAMIEIPPKVAGQPPVNPESRQGHLALGVQWPGASGLAEDIRYYGKWMRDEAEKRIGNLYPRVEISDAMVAERPDLEPYHGEKLTVIAWIWARTVKSPNPAFSHVDVPVVSTFVISKKEGKDAYLQPIIEGDTYRFDVKFGKPPEEARSGTKATRGSNFRCLMSGSPINADYIMTYAQSQGLGTRLLAVVAEGIGGRIFLPPNVVDVPMPKEMPDLSFLDLAMTDDRRWFSPPLYGMPNWKDIFTPRQLVSLTTFSDLVGEVHEKITADAIAAGMTDESNSLHHSRRAVTEYAEAVRVYYC